MTRFVTPPALNPRDRVAVIAPSSGDSQDARHVFDLESVVYPTALECQPVSTAEVVLRTFEKLCPKAQEDSESDKTQKLGREADEERGHDSKADTGSRNDE